MRSIVKKNYRKETLQSETKYVYSHRSNNNSIYIKNSPSPAIFPFFLYLRSTILYHHKHLKISIINISSPRT